jgi:hypothetical protein
MVASTSRGTSPPPAPGAAFPASAHTRSRAAARAARIAVSDRGASAARAAISRDTTGSEATGPNSSGCARSTATSARQSPPSASATTRSVTIFPGSCTARFARHRASPDDRPCARPASRAVCTSSSPPAPDTIPNPSADTVILARRPVVFT